MALLIVNFVPDAPKAMREMCRVTKSDGIVATTMWDGRGNELNRCLWDAALAINPTMKRPSETGKYGSVEALSGLMQDAGLTNVTVGELNMHCHFSCFDDLWQRNLTGEGPGSA